MPDVLINARLPFEDLGRWIRSFELFLLPKFGAALFVYWWNITLFFSGIDSLNELSFKFPAAPLKSPKMLDSVS